MDVADTVTRALRVPWTTCLSNSTLQINKLSQRDAGRRAPGMSLHVPLKKLHAQQQGTQMQQAWVNFPPQHCGSPQFMDPHTSSSDSRCSKNMSQPLAHRVTLTSGGYSIQTTPTTGIVASHMSAPLEPCTHTHGRLCQWYGCTCVKEYQKHICYT